jgi:saccharopine dehydrogenase-like NADP-dependent oxidoreductase
MPCLALRNGHLTNLARLSEPETVFLNDEAFEAFTKADSLDAPTRACQGRVGEVVFKTLRYPGHLDYIRFLLDDLDDLGLLPRRYQFRDL